MASPNVKRTLFGGLGWCAVALGFAGIFLPGLPATEFFLAAAYCFSRSSPRFERWLLAHRWFGPRLRRMRASRGMSRSDKKAALISMWTGISVSCAALAVVNAKASAFVVALGILGTLSIVYLVRTVPEAAPAGS